ncbi:rhombosortase [Vibrio salilacus]|uniref:rhombosortase n=1 Tax=Vibrio salilacus TaxID=1323749 RepID=UPI000C29DF17|nr:rhombosortase [Vibrio salilacus]
MRVFFLLIVISLVCIGLQFDPQASFVNWQRYLILDGQWWRILTGNFTHTNFPHLAMNLGGLWMIGLIFKPSDKALLFCLFMTSAAIGMLNFFSSMNSYVGLSGTLHGLFVYFALQEALNGRKSSWLLVGGVCVKVAWELAMGASQSTQDLINAQVAVDAHLYGTLSGIVLATALYVYQNKARLQRAS